MAGAARASLSVTTVPAALPRREGNLLFQRCTSCRSRTEKRWPTVPSNETSRLRRSSHSLSDNLLLRRRTIISLAFVRSSRSGLRPGKWRTGDGLGELCAAMKGRRALRDHLWCGAGHPRPTAPACREGGDAPAPVALARVHECLGGRTLIVWTSPPRCSRFSASWARPPNASSASARPASTPPASRSAPHRLRRAKERTRAYCIPRVMCNARTAARSRVLRGASSGKVPQRNGCQRGAGVAHPACDPAASGVRPRHGRTPAMRWWPTAHGAGLPRAGFTPPAE